MDIKGYTLLGELKTTNSGFSKWGFARKGGRVYFIKEFIDPVYPVCVDLLDPAMLAHKRQICERYEARSSLLYKAINDCADGRQAVLRFADNGDNSVQLLSLNGESVDVRMSGDSSAQADFLKYIQTTRDTLRKMG